MRTPLLDFYRSSSNTERIEEIQRSRGEPQRAPGKEKGVSVVILTLNKPELIIPLIEQLKKQKAQFEANSLGFEILIGDTGSTDPSVLECYEKNKGAITVIRGLKYHFSKCNNQVAFESSRYEALLFLNNDIVFPEASCAVFEMYQKMALNPGLGALGPILYFEDGSAQHAGIDFSRDPGILGFCYHPQARRPHKDPLKSRKCPAVTGAFLLIRSALFWQIGGMDEGYQAECQDVALCLGVHRLGYSCHVVNQGKIIHLENATRPRGEENWPDRQRFMRKWLSYIEANFL